MIRKTYFEEVFMSEDNNHFVVRLEGFFNTAEGKEFCKYSVFVYERCKSHEIIKFQDGEFKNAVAFFKDKCKQLKAEYGMR